MQLDEGSDVVNDLLRRIREGSRFVPVMLANEEKKAGYRVLDRDGECPRCDTIRQRLNDAEKFQDDTSEWPWFASGIVLLDVVEAIHFLRRAAASNENDLAANVEREIYRAAAIVRNGMTNADHRRLKAVLNSDEYDLEDPALRRQSLIDDGHAHVIRATCFLRLALGDMDIKNPEGVAKALVELDGASASLAQRTS